MNISIIVAVGKNNEIGKNNDLLWHLPADMKHFKELTTGHIVIMGRKTFESLPKGALPNRMNVVLTRNEFITFNNCLIFKSLQEALSTLNQESERFIIGGAEIYKQTFPLADTIYLTQVDADFPDADTFFPSIDKNEWEEISREEHPADEKNPYNYTFLEMRRK